MITTATANGIENVERFFQHIERWGRGFRGRTLHYFGLLEGNEVHLCVARIRLQAPRSPPQRQIAIGCLRAGVLAIPRDIDRAKEIVTRLASGATESIRPGLAVKLPTSDHRRMYVDPPALLHPLGLSAGHRLSVLTIQAEQWPIREGRVELDWTLKSARKPYENLSELLTEFGLPADPGPRCTLEVVAFPPVELSTRSVVRGEGATLGIWVPRGLNRRRASIQYRVLARGVPTVRGSRIARELKWEADGDGICGTVDIKIPRGAVVNCTASYYSVAQQSRWFADPTLILNPRIQALTAIDAALEALRATLADDSAPKGFSAKQFETAVAAVAWAYGLAPLHTEYATQTRDGPDLIATAPSGGVAVIECTIGPLKTHSKLTNLKMRSIAIRERMQAASSVAPTVLPVIVTRLRRPDVVAELDTATELGVLVVTREDLEAAMNEIQLLQDGDSIFRRGLEAVARAQADLEVKRRRPPDPT